MKLDFRQKKLLDFIKIAHANQFRNYTNLPYWTHPLRVAYIYSKYCPFPKSLGIEIALCHDLFEDTTVEPIYLSAILPLFGYDAGETHYIVMGVDALTDAYTSENEPNMNRAQRKRFEANRLARISSAYQSIKLADLIDNTSDIVKFDKKFAKVYLAEKKNLLNHMRQGDIGLFVECCFHLRKGLNQIQ